MSKADRIARREARRRRRPKVATPSATTTSQSYRYPPVRQPATGAAVVGPREMQSLPGVWAALRIIGSCVAGSQILTPDGDPIDPLAGTGFFNSPTAHDTWFTYIDSLCFGLGTHGNAFVVPTRLSRMGDVAEVETIIPTYVILRRHPDRSFEVLYELNQETLTAQDIMHIKLQGEAGWAQGISPLMQLADSMSTYLSEIAYTRNGYEDGGKIPGFLSAPGDEDSEVLQSEAQRLQESAGGRSQRIVALGHGLKWNVSGFSHAELELLAARRWSINEQAMLMGVPPHLIGAGSVEGSSDTYANVRQDMELFESTTLARYKHAIVQAHAQFGINFRFGKSDLARPALGERMAGYKAGIDAGIMSPEEARRMEGLVGPPPEPPAAPETAEPGPLSVIEGGGGDEPRADTG